MEFATPRVIQNIVISPHYSTIIAHCIFKCNRIDKEMEEKKYVFVNLR